ncbi:hypothetical protein Slin15195_G028460 [Septoria linicola]|uniref:Uncharacterized protein n=1 Tax=Septoria linicola TaxID=215465 RepID=A0A9Q9AP42_9PEZI|nr:hypothetical protein Slin14017_G027500 [Septoria linicola]USW49527.1 hypothetical protein Slin15195_G028460 [Septoria linicola]
MATPPEQPWSNNEKNYLLAEIIKAANPPPNVLFNVIQSSQLQPRWEDTPLPPGRSLNSCRYAFEELRRSLLTPMGTAMAAPTPVLGPMAPTLKRPFPYESTYTGGPSGREIRPKPPATSSTHTQPSPTDPPTRKKRGRPTKAEALAKAEAAAATAAPYGEPSPISVQRLPAQTTPQPVAGPHTATMGNHKVAATRILILRLVDAGELDRPNQNLATLLLDRARALAIITSLLMLAIDLTLQTLRLELLCCDTATTKPTYHKADPLMKLLTIFPTRDTIRRNVDFRYSATPFYCQ